MVLATRPDDHWPQSPRLTRRKVRPDSHNLFSDLHMCIKTHVHAYTHIYTHYIYISSGIHLGSEASSSYYLLFQIAIFFVIHSWGQCWAGDLFPQSLLSTGATGVRSHIWLGQNSAECLQPVDPASKWRVKVGHGGWCKPIISVQWRLWKMIIGSRPTWATEWAWNQLRLQNET